jgi:hypothetical protein
MEEEMTGSRKNQAREQLDRLEDALIESILAASEAELREEMAERGEDPDKCLLHMEQIIAGAKAACGKRRMDRAKSELQAWRAGQAKAPPPKFDREAARARFEKIRSRDPELASKMLLAARKGEGLSEKDMEGLLEDIAKLERLDGEDGSE